jgi:hypothetical protein
MSSAIAFDIPEGVSDEVKILFLEAEAATRVLERETSFVGEVVRAASLVAALATFASAVTLDGLKPLFTWLDLKIPNVELPEHLYMTFGIAVGLVSLGVGAFSFLRKLQIEQRALTYARKIAEVQMILRERPNAEAEIRAKLRAVFEVTPPEATVEVR